MFLRLILLFSLIAALTTVLAAPPRFGFPEADDSAHLGSSGQPAAATTPASEQTTSTENLPKPEPIGLVISEDGEKTNAETTPVPQIQEAKPVKPAEPPAVVEPVAGSNKVAMAKPKEERRGFFWMFSRKKAETEPPQHKPEDALVPTEAYHRSQTEKIRAAELYEYRSGYQSYWKSGDASKVLCSIRQQVPNYGYVEFRQGVGQPLEFAMFVNHPPAGVGKAHVRIQAPAWRHYNQGKDLGVVELEPGKRAVSMEANWSNRLMLELSEGMQLVVRYWDDADASTDIEVMLSALNFQKSLQSFHHCLGQLIAYETEEVKRNVVYFHEDSSRLRKQATQQLDGVLEILKADPGFKQIDLELYSSKEGLVQYNFRLSTRRARAVRDYLIKRGIAEDRLLIKIHTKSRTELKQLGYNPSDVHIVLKRKAEKD